MPDSLAERDLSTADLLDLASLVLVFQAVFSAHNDQVVPKIVGMTSEDQRVIKETIEGVLARFPDASTENARDEAERTGGGQPQAARQIYLLLRHRNAALEKEQKAAQEERNRADRLQVRRWYSLEFSLVLTPKFPV